MDDDSVVIIFTVDIRYLCVGSCVVPAMAGRSETDEAEPSKGFVKVYRIDVSSVREYATCPK